MVESSINDLIKSDYKYATVLQHYGIDFYLNRELSLLQACKQKHVETSKIIDYKRVESPYEEEISLSKSSGVTEIVNTLTKSHDYFINSKLPEINLLVLKLKPEYFHSSDVEICEEIKFLFSEFSFGFISHMRNEEKGYFKYIKKMVAVLKKGASDSLLKLLVDSYSLKDFEKGHDNDDDELEEIKAITNNYDLIKSDHLYLTVLYKELKKFEKQLSHHARIEDSLLLPKAIELEKELKNRIARAK